jgi:ActR/RegA family two-component response regulator
MATGTVAQTKMALVVHADMGVLSAFQGALTQNGFVTIVARDVPTTLLAMTQHYFDLAIVSSHLNEPGDGWPVAGVLHLAFPKCFVAVLAPETSVLTLQAAINNGVREIYHQSTPAAEVVSAVLSEMGSSSSKNSKKLQ